MIIKGNKQHRVTFRKKIEDINIVENWKMYNKDLEEDDEDDCPCQLV